MNRVPLEDHRRLDLCHRPRARRKYSTRLWVCPSCGQAWQATQMQDQRLAPDALHWSWIAWPWRESRSLNSDVLTRPPATMPNQGAQA